MVVARSLLLSAALAACASVASAQPAPAPAPAFAPFPSPSSGPAPVPAAVDEALDPEEPFVSPEALVGTWSCPFVTLTALDSLAGIKAAGGSSQLGAMGSLQWASVLSAAIAKDFPPTVIEIPAFEWLNEKENVGFFLTRSKPNVPGDFYVQDDDYATADETYNGGYIGGDAKEAINVGTVIRSYPKAIRYLDPINEDDDTLKEYLIEFVDSNDNGNSRIKQLDEDTMQILYTEAGTLNEDGEPEFSAVQAPSITVMECARVS